MPTAICSNGHTASYSPGKGGRMPKTCAECGQPMTRARLRYDGNGRPTVEPAASRAGKTFVNCTVCGKRRQAPGGNVKRYMVATRVYMDPGRNSEMVIVPAGSYACWYHEIVPDDAEGTLEPRIIE